MKKKVINISVNEYKKHGFTEDESIILNFIQAIHENNYL